MASGFSGRRLNALTDAQRGAITARAKAMSARVPCREADAVSRLLSATRFHPRIIRALARRKFYQEAALALTRIAEPDRTTDFALSVILCSAVSGDVRRHRLAMRFGFFSPEQLRRAASVPVTLDDLRTASGDVRARLVLAALGELDWPSASRQERAIFALRALILALRRASP